MSPPLSRSTSTTPTWPAVAARIRGVKPVVSSDNENRELILNSYLPVVHHTILVFSCPGYHHAFIPFLSRCSMFAPRAMRTETSSSCPPAHASVSAVSWLLSVCRRVVKTSLINFDVSLHPSALTSPLCQNVLFLTCASMSTEG